MSERSEIERLGIELAKELLDWGKHSVDANGMSKQWHDIVGKAREVKALAAPPESPLPWPGCDNKTKIEAIGGNWRFHSGPDACGLHAVRILFPTYQYTRAAAIAEWNRIVKSLAPTTPEGWREVVVDGGQVVLFHDQTAWLCYSATGSVVQGDTRKTGESDADLLARLNPPPGTPVIRVRRASQ